LPPGPARHDPFEGELERTTVMIFSTPAFFAFFVIYFGLHFAVPRQHRLWLIIIGSTVFYAAWKLEYVWIPFVLMAIAYLGGRWIESIKDPTKRWRRTATALVVLLLPLAIFKYADFVYRDVFGPFFGVDHGLLNLSLPLGISFVSFTLMAYLVDIFRGVFPASHRPKTVLAYVLFFPHLIAGPILQPHELIPQLENPRAATLRGFTPALAIFTLGLVKKLIFADQLSPMVTATYAQDATSSSQAALLAIIGFAVQVYCDFSGYTDMAIGLAAMLGIKLPNNFLQPFTAISISDLWQRWHITLVRCLRDYVYMPLSMILARHAATRRLGKWPMFLLAVVVPTNVTFLVSGIWHGAGWNFILFGIFTGLAMTVEFAWRRAAMPELPTFAAWLLTMLAFLISLCFFRAHSPGKAIDMMVAAIAGSWSAAGPFFAQNLFPIFLIVIFAASHRFDDHRLVGLAVSRARPELTWAAIFFCWIVAIAVSQGSSGAFVYFDF
jgi:alginate O-acetyltransferase complex protein AlgI